MRFYPIVVELDAQTGFGRNMDTSIRIDFHGIVCQCETKDGMVVFNKRSPIWGKSGPKPVSPSGGVPNYGQMGHFGCVEKRVPNSPAKADPI